MSAKPLTAAPRIAPTVLQARTSPTARPTAFRCLAWTSPASGKAAPMKNAGTSMYTKASAKLDQVRAPKAPGAEPPKAPCSRIAFTGTSRRKSVTRRAETPMTICTIPNQTIARAGPRQERDQHDGEAVDARPERDGEDPRPEHFVAERAEPADADAPEHQAGGERIPDTPGSRGRGRSRARGR